jgi:hypothetical protein
LITAEEARELPKERRAALSLLPHRAQALVRLHDARTIDWSGIDAAKYWSSGEEVSIGAAKSLAGDARSGVGWPFSLFAAVTTLDARNFALLLDAVRQAR